MTSLGRITVAAASGTVDTTFALANINFDFSLFKVPAPKEFEGVGSALSANRRKDAENGRAHVTARRLAALFDSLLPATPELVKAYGERASDISQSQISGPEVQSNGVFAGQAGADSTSIWAAATSGQTAIRVHLLACMLARIWNSSEATSIWVEIVEERKQRILSNFDETNTADIATYMAAQQEITRTQLAEWDASARSWLRTADRHKKLQQTQLEVIIRSIRVPVNTKPQVYGSVTQAWTTALSGVECLIKGMPQQMQTGEILLGLSSWHIYPDLLVLDASSTVVKQHDTLVRHGGILTIGLQTAAGDAGVHWSLPLAHLRYYGDPVIASRSIAIDGSRLTIDELLQAVLGCVIGSMLGADLDKTEGTAAFAEWLVRLSHRILEALVRGSPLRIISYNNTWLCKLSDAAQTLLQSEGAQRQRYLQLIALGKRCSMRFLPAPCTPYFGLSDFPRYMRLIRKTETKIKVLRKLASFLDLERHDLIIRYRHECSFCSWPVFEYTTALPQPRVAVKRTSDGDEKVVFQHARWIHRQNHHDETSPTSPRYSRYDLGSPELESTQDELFYGASVEEEFVHAAPSGCCKDFGSRRVALTVIGEETYPLEDQELRCYDIHNGIKIPWPLTQSDVLDRAYTEFSRSPSPRITEIDRGCEILVGRPDDAALFIRKRDDGGAQFQAAKQKIPRDADLSDMVELFSIDNMCLQTLVKEFGDSLKEAPEEYLQSLKAVASVASIYKLLPHATISVRMLNQKINEVRWLPSGTSVHNVELTANHYDSYRNQIENILEYLRPYELTRTQAFACICLQESGQINLDSEHFSNVMALSTGDSIYVAAPLLCDPSETPHGQEIRRIVGNVGRSGIALLTPPSHPRIKSSELDSWALVNNRDFDGNMQDCFGDSSLHLSFTGFSLPVDTGVLGGQDSEVNLLESVVSVHERGKWVADLDILQAMESHLLKRLPSENCLHGMSQGQHLTNLTSIENWTEFLERPKRETLFQARRNWQARLAATTIAIAQENTTYVLGERVCWDCMIMYLGSIPSERPFIIIG